MDLVVQVPHHPVPGETVLGSDYATYPGGKGANQAVAAARQGAEVTFVGCVGDDSYGAALRIALVNDGVDVTYLRSASGPSGVTFIQVASDGQNSIVLAPGANAKLRADDVLTDALAGRAAVVLQLEVPLEVSLAAARMAKRQGLAVVLNLAPAQQLGPEQLANVTHLVTNEHEAALLLGTSGDTVRADPVAAAEALTEFVPTTVVTVGADGAAWSSLSSGGRRSGLVPAFAVDVIDTTAAGDAFVGAFVRELVELGDGPDNVAAAVRHGAAAGALAATGAGAQPSLPTREAVAELLSA